ncbi:hypothetical protein FSP39_015422 [Pinctada imbricata]|uniref:Ig-like domain-containing protein n=1 Tax=Pinctada imbricata TaxID=66713 RepID=A0AA89BJG1_PINIB|nr:hypothetical protein FSP39_015422 [Pinctada imbricata]
MMNANELKKILTIISTALTIEHKIKHRRTPSKLEELQNNDSEFYPLVPQLVRSSVTVDNNGMALFTLDLINADQVDCFFTTFDDEEVGMKTVYKDRDGMKGVLLLKQNSPHHIAIFSCYSKYQPTGAQYVLSLDVKSEPFSVTKTSRGYDCMMSKPTHINQQNSTRIEVLSFCSNNVTWDDVGMMIEGSVLIDGNIYELSEKVKYEERYEEVIDGVLKASFILPKNISSGTDVITVFSMTYKDEIKGDMSIQKAHFVADDKSLDGSEPAVRLGNLAMKFYPTEKDVLYLSKGSTQRLYCMAFGNPKPKIDLKKDSFIIDGETELDVEWTQFSGYKYFTLDEMDESREGRYTCIADTGIETASRTVDVRLCVPANVLHSISIDDDYVNITLTATYDETNKIERTNCFKSEADGLTWLGDSITEEFRGDNHWNLTYSLQRDIYQVPLTMTCNFEAVCNMGGMTLTIEV